MVKKKIINEKQGLDLAKAIALVKKNSEEKKRNFVETVDMAINLGIDPKQSTQNVRGSVVLPAGSGKKVRIAVFSASEAQQKEALEAGAVVAGGEELIDKVAKGFMEFDTCIATPDIMPKLGKAARKLGPRGLMPNAKNGNITTDVKKAIAESLKGKVSFKNDKFAILHCGVGKVSFSDENLISNIKALVSKIKEMKPEGSKGKYLKEVYLSTTMGPSVLVNVE